MRYYSHYRHPCQFLQFFRCSLHAGYVTSEIVEYYGLHTPAVIRMQEIQRPNCICIGTAPFNVDDKYAIGICRLRRPHVRYVGIIDIYLGRGPSALHYHEIVSALKEIYALLQNFRSGPGYEFRIIICRAVISYGSALQYYLGHPVPLWLHEYGIDPEGGPADAGCPGLEILYHGDLMTSVCDPGVEAHIL